MTQTRKLVCLVAVVTLVSACSKAGDDRPLTLKPGVYQGEPDEKLDEATKRKLDERANMMR